MTIVPRENILQRADFFSTFYGSDLSVVIYVYLEPRGLQIFVCTMNTLPELTLTR